ncbi:hypothetical protein FACS189430_12020 [Bacteroidia bacterium]|nr:hypothetical protein FACS189430_12020 [Bacteroidia bacterium]
MNHNRTTIPALFLIAAVIFGVLYFRHRNAARNFEAERDAYRQDVIRLQTAHDSLLRVLTARETAYRAARDSLDAEMAWLKTVQTQNAKQHEATREHIVRMSDDERYCFVSEYIEEYNKPLPSPHEGGGKSF